MITTTIRCDHHKIDLTSVYFPHSGLRGHAHREDAEKHRVTLQQKHFRVISGDFNAQLGLRIDSEEDYVEEHTTGQTNKRGIWIRQWCMIQNYVALITTFKKTTENSAPAYPQMEKRNIWTAW